MKELKFLKFAVEKHPTTGIQLEYLIKNDAIAVLVVNEKGDKTLLVNQYRPGVAKNIFEIPAGIIEDGESAISTLYRELEEETGYAKEDVELLYASEKPFVVSPGYTQERLYIYIVRVKDDNIVPKNLNLDIGEDLYNQWFEIEEAAKISEDMKTSFALEIYRRFF